MKVLFRKPVRIPCIQDGVGLRGARRGDILAISRPGLTDEYVSKLPPPLRGPAREMVALVREAVPDRFEAYKWDVPMFHLDGVAFCYLSSRKDNVSLGFHRGRSLADPENRLVSITAVAQDTRHVVVKIGEPVPTEYLRALVTEAVRLAREEAAAKKR